MCVPRKSDIASLIAAHQSFARWERVRHRARTVTLIAFPDGHPLRRSVDAICNNSNLETCRLKANKCLAQIIHKYGSFQGYVNGFWFDSPKQLFEPCPEK